MVDREHDRASGIRHYDSRNPVLQTPIHESHLQHKQRARRTSVEKGATIFIGSQVRCWMARLAPYFLSDFFLPIRNSQSKIRSTCSGVRIRFSITRSFTDMYLRSASLASSADCI